MDDTILISSDDEADDPVILNTAKTNIGERRPVDLDAEDIEFVKVTDKKQNSEPKDVELVHVVVKYVCYGMIRAPVLLYYTEQPAISVFSVKMSLDKVKDQKHNSISFSIQEGGEKIAVLNAGHARFLDLFVRYAQFEAYIDCYDFQRPFAKLLVYGTIKNIDYIAHQLTRCKAKFEQPDIQPKQPYCDPLRYMIDKTTIIPTDQHKVLDQTKQQIEELYKSFTSHQNLEEMNQDLRLTTKLFKYQRQALHWMCAHEQIQSKNQITFWKHETNCWRNILTETISKLRPVGFRGGILADDMGLGKTIQIISLILKSPPNKLCSLADEVLEKESPNDPFGFISTNENSTDNTFDGIIAQIPSKSTLIICPLSLIHNWQDQIESHTKKGSLSVLVYHGPLRSTNPYDISKFDVVVTTYNIIGVSFGKEVSPLHKIYWHRIVLDEAHIIKSTSTVQAKATFMLRADIKWCLTGTPIQNKLDDLYSLVKFIRISPLDKKSIWIQTITRPIAQSKNIAAFRKLQTMMRGITLRRVKTDLIDGKPIITLPPRTEEVVVLDLSKSERQIYDKIHLTGRRVFDNLRAQGTVMSNFALILKIIMLMRQACLHPQMPKFVESDFAAELLPIDHSIPLSAEYALDMYKLLAQASEDYCVFCNTKVESSGIYMSPCKHLSLQQDSKDQCSSKGQSSNDSCPLCLVPIIPKNLVAISETIIDVEDPIDFDLPMIYDTKATKIEALLNDLSSVRSSDKMNNAPLTKSVIFSQFTTMLTLCQEPLRKAGYKYVRLDGTMSRIHRSAALNDFKNRADVTVFLISIKAGGVGLNLVSANRVYLLEPYWNPAVEQQAVDRVHRLGQTKPVTTIRYIIKNSVEENMQKRQKYKTALAQIALEEEEGESAGSKGKNKRRNKIVVQADKETILLQKLESIAILFK